VNLRALDPGFDATNVTTARVSLQDARYATAAAINRLFDEGLAELSRTPGVESAAVSLELPYTRLLNSGFRLATDPLDDDHQFMSNFMYVSPAFFETLSIPVRAGRAFAGTDRTGTPLVAIVNETFVRAFAGGRDPLSLAIGRGATARAVVGVVGDVQVKNSGIQFPGRVAGPIASAPIVFIPTAQTS
jgi:putative ABC transport system permease protein